jgi:propanol-preferring alcohol dehydrogenase
MRTMAAFRITAWERPPELVEVPVPEPGPGQVRVRVAGCGLCHSDLTMSAMPGALGEQLGWRVPFTLGHETAGWVDAVGSGVSGWVEGEPVALASPASCGSCRWCLRGQENACPAGLVGRGYGRDGGLAEHVIVDDATRLFRLGALDPLIAGPLTDAGATSYHAVHRLLPRIHGDGTALVIGAGGLGAFVVQILAAVSDAHIVAIDPSPARRSVALELGAHEVIDGVDEATAAELRSLVGPDGADVAIDLVGTDATIATGIDALGAGGGFALVGAAGGKRRRPWYGGGLPRDGEVFTFQGSDLADARAVIELAAAGRIRSDIDAFPLDRVADGYAALHDGSLHGRAVIQP